MTFGFGFGGGASSPDSPYGPWGQLTGVVPEEVYIAGKASLKLGAVDQAGNDQPPIPAFALLGKVRSNGTLTMWDKDARVIVSQESAWTSSIDFSLGFPVYGDTITVGEIVLTLIESGGNTGGEFEVGGGNGQIDYLPSLSGNIAQWFNDHPQYNITAQRIDDLCRITSTLPGTAGNGRTVSSSCQTFYATNEQGSDLVYGDIEQEPDPVGVAAFPAERGSVLAYFSSGSFDRRSLVWPASITTVAQQRAAVRPTRLKLLRRP